MKKILTVALACVLLFSLIGCGKDGQDGGQTEQDIRVWSTYSTAKVMFDRELNGNYVDLGQKLSVSLARGECEMAQIVITAENAVDNYSVTVSDLKSGENTFKKENIAVYHQKSIEITEKSSGNQNEKFPIGLTPDCLLPMDKAVEYKENKVNAKSNQPVSFEFCAPVDQASGEYTGDFKVVADGKEFTVPVTLNVWNYTLPQGMSGKSCMLIYQQELKYGEMDDSDEMYITYFEELLRNKGNAWHVPYTATGPEEMAQSVIKYWDYENFNSFGMPDKTIGNDVDYVAQKKYLLELGRKSTEDRILFDKAYFYHTVIDEPYAFEDKHKMVTTIIGNVNNLFTEVIAQLDAEGMFEGKPEFKERMDRSIHNMPQIVTSMFSGDYAGSNLTYCPPIQYLNNTEERDNLNAHADEFKTETWTYTCNNPTYPYPSTHIDDYLIGSRIMRWMQKSYNVEGYLSWAVNQYSQIVPFTHNRVTINPYIEPKRVQGPGIVANGDGYLFYPAKKYNSDKPLSSIRLKSLRDGQDDYDALSLLQSKYNEFAEYYAVESGINSDEILQNVYDVLFNGTIYNSSDVAFDAARNTVAEMIENTALDEKFVSNAYVQGNALKVEMYLNNGYDLKVNGKSVSGEASGQGMKFVHSIPLNEFDGTVTMTVSKDGYSKDYAITRGKVHAATDFANGKGAENFNMGKNNSIAVNGSVADITVNSVDRGADDANIRYTTKFNIQSSAFDTTFDSIDKIYFDVTNKEQYDISFTINLMIDGVRNELVRVTVKANSTQTVSIDRIYGLGIKNLNQVESVMFAFDNAYSENGIVKLYEPRKISLGDIFYTEK